MHLCMHAHVAWLNKDGNFPQSQGQAIECDGMKTLAQTLLTLCAIMAASSAEAAVLTKGLPAFNVVKVWALHHRPTCRGLSVIEQS